MSEIEAAKTPSQVEAVSLNVSDLSFTPSVNYVERPLEFIRYNLSLVNLDFFLPFYYGPTKVYRNVDGVPLRNVTFTAFSGELVGVLGSELERRELVQLLTGTKKSGSYDGSISLRGNGITTDSYYYNHVAYVQKKPLYVPGCTYLDLVTQAAEMRLEGSGVDVTQRVDDVLTIMNLQRVKDRVMAQFPSTIGEAGCDLRRLNIAMQIVTLPALIVVDEPSVDQDPFYTLKVLSCLKRLTKRGHIVVCASSKPSQTAFDLFDRVVLLSEGYSIYAGSPLQIDEHFCSNELGFQHKNDITTVDFATGVRTGVERSGTGQVGPQTLHNKFEESKLHVAPNNDSANAQAFTPDFFIFFGLKGDIPSAVVTAKRFWTALKRAFVYKFKDHLQLFSLFFFSVVIASLIGYLQYGQGSYGNYCISVIGLPFKNTTNIGFVFFIFALFPQVHFFLEAHTISQKMRIFRNEQDAKVSNAATFFAVTLLSEAPFALVYGLAFGSIVFGMTDLAGHGSTNYGYWICTALMSSVVGCSTNILYCALFRKQKAIRNMFFVTVVIMIMLSGYPFTQHNMPYYLVDFSEIIPTRWIYEGLFKWYFAQKIDGVAYLNVEGYTQFKRSDLFLILRNFLLIMNGITLVRLFPAPILLSRGTPHSEANSTKTVDPSAPAVAYTEVESEKAAARREGEVVAITTGESPNGGRVKKIVSAPRKKVPTSDEESNASGTFVTLKDLTYQVPGATVLQRVTGQFEAGRLNLILGAAQSGKSSLLNVVAGNVSDNAKVSGEISFDGKAATDDVPAYQRCGFVASETPQYRDLTVTQVVSFALKLRVQNTSDVVHSTEAAIAALHLEDVANVKVKHLTKGEFKRLSIAEETVHNPKLLLLDQPTTNVGEEEGSLIVNTLREMVNNDRTVVASLAHPTIEEYNLFDTVLLLSEGRVIYSGRVDAAVEYFRASPFRFSNDEYKNPADFLIDISAGQVLNDKGETVSTDQLENHYLQSDNFRGINPAKDNKTGTLEIGNDTQGAQIAEHKPQNDVFLAIKAGWAFLTKCPSLKDLTDSLRTRVILLHRASLALAMRYELIIATTMTHIILGILYGWVNKNVSPASVIAYLGVGCLFLLVAAGQLVYYIHNNYNVFLKEHKRGLYSSYTNYTVHSWPLYILAAVNGILFAVPSWGMMDINLHADMFGVILVVFIFTVICATMIVEVNINLTNDAIGTHFIIICMAAFQFMIGGLFLKSGSFRHWLEPWITSLSIIRWVMQAGFVKMYADNYTEFPMVFPNAPTYTLYNGYLNLFGWGGKTARYCVGMLIIVSMFWRFFTFCSMILGAQLRKGTHKAVAA